MKPALNTGEFVLISKFSYGIRIPQNNDEVPFGIIGDTFSGRTKKWQLAGYKRVFGDINSIRIGDVVILRNPQNLTGVYAKRVNKKGGNGYQHDGKLIIIPSKGMLLDLDRCDREILDLLKRFELYDYSLLKKNAFKQYRVKLNYYYVLGDNTKNALDSRSFGLVPETCIIGKIIFNISRMQKQK